MPALIGGETWGVIRARIEEIFTAAGTITANLAAALAAKTAAEAAQSSASGSATSASGSASSAAGSAGAASAAASAASASAAAASSSATTASTHMSNASTQATNAAASATAAANIYDAFDDRYLGAKPANPTLDNDGNTLIVGAIYFNTAVGEMRVWNGAAWLTSFVPSALYMQRSQNLADVADPAASIANLGIISTAAEINLLHGADATLLPILAKVPASLLSVFDDPIINGSFKLWQRNVVNTTAVGLCVADRWINGGLGGVVTMSRQAFSPGDRLGMNEPIYFLRQAVSGQTLATQYALIAQRLEDVRRLAGRKITIMGWARRTSGAGNMAVNVLQSFGTGGTPSASVQSAGKSIALSGVWTPFAIDIDVPSIAGKVLGTNPDSFTAINFFTSAGSNFNSEAANLGLQTIGVDLWGVHVREGLIPVAATGFYKTKAERENQSDCARFFETGTVYLHSQTVGTAARSVQFGEKKREAPAVSLTNVASSGVTTATLQTSLILDTSFTMLISATSAGGAAQVAWTADAEL